MFDFKLIIKTIISPRLYLLLGLIVVMFLLSSYLYFIKPNRLEPHVLYYYKSATADTEEQFTKEIRNIPIDINLDNLENLANFFLLKTTVLHFVEELLLGPNNIYAQHYASKFVDFNYLSENKKENTLYISLRSKDNVILADKNKKKIEKWLLFNIHKNYNFDAIYILFDKKLSKNIS